MQMTKIRLNNYTKEKTQNKIIPQNKEIPHTEELIYFVVSGECFIHHAYCKKDPETRVSDNYSEHESMFIVVNNHCLLHLAEHENAPFRHRCQGEKAFRTTSAFYGFYAN